MVNIFCKSIFFRNVLQIGKYFWIFFPEIFLAKIFLWKYFGENIFIKNFFEIFFRNIFGVLTKYFCENIFGENIFDENIFGEYIFVKIFLDHSLITKDFPFLTKVPLLHLHPFEVKCDKLTYAMSVPFIVLDGDEEKKFNYTKIVVTCV